MSTLNKYIIYKCSICDRETEILLDARRPDPVRCNITLHCRGLLSKSGERASKGFLFTPLVAGLDDYIPRGQSKAVVPTISTPKPISIFTGTGVMSLAAFHRELDQVTDRVIFWINDANGRRVNVETPSAFNAKAPVNAHMIVSLFEITPALLKFKKYTYNVGSGDQLIRGIDNSPTGKNLRFDSMNLIKVILNGVEQTPEKYDRTINNQITMTPAITIPNSILEILVWDELPSYVPTDELIELKFVSYAGGSVTDLTLRDATCWGDFYAADFSRITEREGVRSLLHCFDTTELDVTKTYGVAKAEMVSASGLRAQVANDDFYLMLGKEPHLFQDKELNAYILGTRLLSQDTSLNFRQSVSTGNYELIVDQSLITQKYNPIMPTLPVPNAETLAQTAEAQTTLAAEDLKRKYILGPS